MNTISWQLVRGKAYWNQPVTWTSPLIGYFGGGFYSHIDVLTPFGMLRGARSDVIRGIPSGVQDRPQHYAKWERCTRYTVDVSDGEYDRYWEFSAAQLGKPYDDRGLLKTFVLDEPRDWRQQDSWWCSELVAATGEHAGIWVIPPEVQAVNPGDCAYLFAGKRARIQELTP